VLGDGLDQAAVPARTLDLRSFMLAGPWVQQMLSGTKRMEKGILFFENAAGA
jgi:hypothetical protein